MEVAATTSIWAVLLPVIIGGLITALGTWAGPIIAHILTSKTAGREKREKLFETMVSSVYEFDHWMDQKRNVYAYGEKQELPYSPLAKGISIASMHFPKALPLLKEIDLQAAGYQFWMTEAAGRRLKGQLERVNDGFVEAYSLYSKTVHAFQEAIPDMVSEYKISS